MFIKRQNYVNICIWKILRKIIKTKVKSIVALKDNDILNILKFYYAPL